MAEMFVVLEEVRSYLIGIIWQLESPGLSEEQMDYLIFRLEQISRHLLRIKQVHTATANFLIEDVAQCIALLSNCNLSLQQAFQVPIEGNHIGRPRFDIPREQLEYLLSYEISVTDIAKVLGVSRSTIHSRFRKYEMSVGSRWANFIYEDLYVVVYGIMKTFPNAGYRRVHSQLLSQNIKVPKLMLWWSDRPTQFPLHH